MDPITEEEKEQIESLLAHLPCGSHLIRNESILEHQLREHEFSTDHSSKKPTWEGNEHQNIGNRVSFTINKKKIPAQGYQILNAGGSVPLDFGAIVSLAGDFYGLPDRPISDGVNNEDRKSRFLDAFHSLSNCDGEELKKVLAVMQIEIDAIDKAVKEGKDVAEVWKNWGDEHSREWNKITGGETHSSLPWYSDKNWGRYMKMASVNWDHFGIHAKFAYTAGHDAALEQAKIAHANGNVEQFKLALAMDAFACHYLTDLFSAGHIRTPRKALHNDVFYSSAGDLCSMIMHNEDNQNGLHVVNARRESWKAFGDKKLFDEDNKTNLLYCTRAVQKSVDEVCNVFKDGNLIEAYEALEYVPDIEWITKYPQGGPNGSLKIPPNPSPLFKIEGEKLKCRSSYNNLKDYSWTSAWTAPTVVLNWKSGVFNPPPWTDK